MTLGALALGRNNGSPSAALADLFTQVIGMCGFIGVQGAASEDVLKVFDELCISGRAALVDILNEEKSDG